METMDLRVGLAEIFSFIERNSFSRSVREAEKILLANHLVTCGITSKKDGEIAVISFCLQTSNLLEKPHTIEGIYLIENNELRIKKMTCTCKGGAGGQCKHSVAVLIYCNRLVISF